MASANRPEIERLRTLVRDVADFPEPGVLFKDITPLLADGAALALTVDSLTEGIDPADVDRVAGIEARGFIVAAPVAYRLRAGMVPVRKAGKLPWQVDGVDYGLEYGTDRLEIHRDAVRPGDRVLIVDDVLATGGTAAAAVRLVESLGGRVVGLAFIIELAFLGGRSRLGELDARALLVYD